MAVKNIEVKSNDGEANFSTVIGVEPENITIYKDQYGQAIPSTDPNFDHSNNIIEEINNIVVPAPKFNILTDYGVGDYVTYLGKTYRFTEAHTAGDWNAQHVVEVSIAGQYVTAGKKANTTLGEHATAEGYNTTASGKYSHAEGNETTANEVSSHVEGYNTTANGIASHAEGYNTNARKIASHAEGVDTTAWGDCSHAEGASTTVNHNYSHAEGYVTKTGTNYQHVQGKYNIGKSTTLFEIGNGTDDDTRSNAFEVDTSGNVLAAGTITDGQGRTLGELESVIIAALFNTNTAYYVGDYVTYQGKTYRFTSDHTAGNWNSNQVIEVYIAGQYVTAGKKADTTLGAYATAEGLNTTASGRGSHAEGSNYGSYSAIFNILASGEGAHAEGCVFQSSITASGKGSHAEGYANRSGIIASGEGAHAEGQSTIASGDASHAEGILTTASGDASHAEGTHTTASHDYSHAEGISTTASHDYSHAEGYYTQTGRIYQHVQGKWNIGKSTTLFEIGNGTADDARSNALEVDTSGNLKATSYANFSSRKYKTNIEPMTNEEALKLLQLTPVKYDYIAENMPNNQYGLIAEDVEPIVTYPIVYENNEPDSIDYSKFVPALIKMVQLLQNENNKFKEIFEVISKNSSNSDEINNLLKSIK